MTRSASLSFAPLGRRIRVCNLYCQVCWENLKPCRCGTSFVQEFFLPSSKQVATSDPAISLEFLAAPCTSFKPDSHISPCYTRVSCRRQGSHSLSSAACCTSSASRRLGADSMGCTGGSGALGRFTVASRLTQLFHDPNSPAVEKLSSCVRLFLVKISRWSSRPRARQRREVRGSVA